MEVGHRAQEDGEEVMETEAVTSQHVVEVKMETESPETNESPGFRPDHDVSSRSFWPSKPSGCGLPFLDLHPGVRGVESAGRAQPSPPLPASVSAGEITSSRSDLGFSWCSLVSFALLLDH